MQDLPRSGHQGLIFERVSHSGVGAVAGPHVDQRGKGNVAVLALVLAACAPAAPPPVTASVPATKTVAAPDWRPRSPKLGHFLGSQHDTLEPWAVGPMLGALELKTARSTTIVTMPRNEKVACASWSDDGTLVAAASKLGSLALWSKGRLLADWPGSTPLTRPCSEYDFVLEPRTERVVVTIGYQTARVLGAGLAVTIGGNDPNKVVEAKFSPDGRRLFAVVDYERVLIYDALTGKPFKELPGTRRPEFSPSGRYFSLSTRGEDGEPGANTLHVTSTLEPHRGGDERDVAMLADSFGPDAFADAGPWRVGGDDDGYGVFDVRNNQRLASWRPSGYGCGYTWVWQGPTLIFIEGPLLTFWTERSGAKTHRSGCMGAQAPMLSKDRKRVLALDSIWDVATGKPIAHLERSGDAEVWGFSRDEQSVLGTIMFNGQAFAVGWDAATGRVLWQKKVAEVDPELARLFIDDRNGKPYWVGHVVDPEHGVQPLIFNETCWTGAAALPRGKDLAPGIPARRCPELLTELQQMLPAHGFAPPVRN